jgi:perilipin-2
MVPSVATRVRLVRWELQSFILAQRSVTFDLVIIEFSEPSATDSDDKFTSTVHTVGRLSNKFARRVYNILSSQVKNLNKDNVQQYINSLATIMHLTNYLSALNQNLKTATSSNETQNSEVGKSSSSTQKREEKKSTIA